MFAFMSKYLTYLSGSIIVLLSAVTAQAQTLGYLTFRNALFTHKKSVWVWLVGGQPDPGSCDSTFLQDL